MKVLQIIDTLGMGGAETWLMEVLRLWSGNGAGQMDFLATSGEPGVFDAEAQRLGARIHYLPFSRKTLRNFVTGFRGLLREGQYQALHDHQDFASGWHFLAGRGVLPPVRVTHVHNPSYQILAQNGQTPARRLASRIGRRLVARHATHIAATSRQVLDEYRFHEPLFQHLPKSALYCGIATERFSADTVGTKESLCREFGWPDDAKIILIAGRMDHCPELDHPWNHKNSAFAVAAGIAAAQRDARIHLLFAGKTSPALPAFQAQIAAAGLSEHFHFAGIRRDMGRLMLGSDVLLFPSRGEGLGMAAVEAQAAGLPVLASLQVPRECVVVPGLVRFEDVQAGPQLWAEALIALAAQPRDAAQANRMVRASPFAIEHSAAALLRLYHGAA